MIDSHNHDGIEKRLKKYFSEKKMKLSYFNNENINT